jgi:glycerophosphoryl diester phosphodiesterase
VSLANAEERDTATLVKAAHDAGLQVLTWSMGPDDMDDLVAAGVDCLCIDNVATALASPPQWQPRTA